MMTMSMEEFIEHAKATMPADVSPTSQAWFINKLSVAFEWLTSLQAENKKLREAVKELICRLEWVVTSNDESRLVNGSIEQGRQALGETDVPTDDDPI